MSSDYAAGTAIGNRENNEDSYVCDPDSGLWFVADGVGGLALGETASAICAYQLTTLIRAGHGVNQSIEKTHKCIRAYADESANGANMGAALVLILARSNLYNIFWAGDCRAYLFDGKLRQLTRDHTYSLPMKDEAQNQTAEPNKKSSGITKALGIKQLESVRADSLSFDWQVGQKLLLCSDGLSGCVSDQEIEAVLLNQNSDQEQIDELIALGVEKGDDNVTVILILCPAIVTLGYSDDTQVPSREVLAGLK